MRTHAVVRLNEDELTPYAYRMPRRHEGDGAGRLFIPRQPQCDANRMIDAQRLVYYVENEAEAQEACAWLAETFPGTTWLAMELIGTAHAIVERVQKSTYDKQKGLIPV